MLDVRGQIKNLNLFAILIFAFTLVNVSSVFAGPNRTTYQAKIVKPDGYPLESSNVNFKFTILDPAGSCILYSETYSSVNMASTGGLISFALGSGVKVYPVSATTFEQVFSNITPTLACDAGGPPDYSPSASDTRKIVMQFHDGTGWQTLPAMTINAVPYAMYANEASSLNGKTDAAFVELANVPTCLSTEALQYNGASFSCVSTTSVSAAAVVSALGYTPANAASVTALTSSLSTTDSTLSAVSSSVFSVASEVASVSSSVFAVSSTVSSLSSSVTSLQNSTAASFAAITSSQWIASGTTISYDLGNVGIGTTNPTAKLEVSGAITAISGGGALNLRTSSSSDHTYMQFYARSANPTSRTGYIGYPTSGSNNLNIFNETSAGLISFGTSGTNRMVITSAGAVGIGVTLPVTKLEISGGVKISMEAAACAAGYAGTIRYNAGLVEYCNGTVWSAFGVAGAGITLLNGSASGTQTFVTGISGTNFGITSSNGVHTFNIPLAASSSVTAGLLSNDDYTAFSNKVSATSASVISALGYAPASATGVATLASNLNTVSSTVATAQSNINSVSSSVSALATSTAASFSAITSSQWVTSGSAISYNAGSVGVGTAGPEEKFHVSNGWHLFDNLYGIRSKMASGTIANVLRTTASDQLIVGSGNWNSLSFHTGAADRMVITSAGAVGIGVTAPVAKVHVANGNIHVNDLTNSTVRGIYFTPNDNSLRNYVQAYQSTTAPNDYLQIGSHFGSVKIVTGSAAASPTARITVLNNGLVGVGTSAPVTRLDVAGGVKISMEAATCAVSFAGTLRYNSGSVEYCNGTSWAAFGVSTSGLTSLNGSTSQTQTYATGITGTVFNISSNNGVHTFNIPLAASASVTAGLLSNVDYANFSNKITSSAASVAQVLGYVPASATALANYLVRSNNLSDLTSSASARTNLGLGGFATVSSLDLGSASATGTLAEARLPSFVNISSGTQYTKVTVDGKGRVTSGAQLNVTDVTTALGYTPASASASSKWTASGTTISYVAGNVGIGTSSPTDSLHVVGNSGGSGAGHIFVQNTNAGGGAYGGIGLNADSGVTIGTLLGTTSSGWNGGGAGWTGIPSGSGFLLGGSLNFGTLAGGSTSQIRFFTNGAPTSSTQRMVINNLGNVGIGIASPEEQLHLSKVLKFTNTVGVSNFRAPTADSFRIFNHDDSSTGNSYGTGDNNATIFENVDSNNPAPDDSMYFINHGSTGPVHAFAIKGSGNVGIGTANPTAKLHLTSGSTSVAPIKLTAGNLLSAPQSGTIEYDGTYLYVTDSANSRKAILTDTGGNYAVSNLTSAGNITMTPNSSVVVSSTAASTNSTTGALIVKGGLGVAGNINAAGTINTTSTMQATSITATTGMITPYIAGGVASGGAITIDSTTNAGKGNINLNPQGGKVGIGYTLPLAKLHIGGNISGTYRSWMDNGMVVGKFGDSDGGYFGLKDEGVGRQDTVVAWGDDSNDMLRFIHTASGGVSDGIEVMRMTPAGNVGIGLTNPTQSLTTSGNVLVGQGGYPALFLRDTSWWMGVLRQTETTWPDADSFVFSTPTGRPFVFQSGAASQTEGTPLMYIDTSGAVGIAGITTPLTTLDVNGSVNVRGGNVFVNHDAAANTNNDYMSFDDNNIMGTGGAFIFNADATRSVAWTGATAAIAARAGYFMNNVAIGTTVTSRTLEVNGSINAGGMVAETFTFTVDATSNGTWAIGSLSNNGTVVHATFDMHVHNGSTIDALKFQVSLPTYSNGTFYTGWQELPVAFGSSAWNGQKNYVVDVLRTSASSGQPVFFRVRNKNGNGSSSAMKIRMTYNSDQTFTRLTNQNTVGTAFNAVTAPAGGPVDGMYGALEYSFPVAVGQGWRPADNSGLFVKNSGYVGIGTGTPNAQLHVASGPTMTGGYSRNLTLHAQHPVIQFKGISDTNRSAGIGYDAQASSEGLKFWTGATTDDIPGTGTLAMMLSANGNVGIGTTTPSEKLEVSGSVKAAAYLYTSDRRLKKDIITLPDALANVLKLRGVNFVWKNNNEKTMGFIAQEVEAVYPELVKTDKVSGFKAVQYGNIVAILVEAIKQENKERVEAQNRCEAQIANVQRAVASVGDKSDVRINQLEKENQELKLRLEKIEKFLNEKVK